MPMKNPPHPGRGLKDEFDFLGLTTTQAAEALGVSRMQVHRVVSEKSAISPEMALRLEAVVGSTADHWLRLQSSYDLAQLRNAGNPAEGLRRLPTPAAEPEQPSLM